MEANPSLEGMHLRNDIYEFPLSHFTITITNSERPTLRSARTVPCEGGGTRRLFDFWMFYV